MESSEIPVLIFAAIIGAIFVIVIVGVIFAQVLDRRGIKNSKKIDAGTPGDHGVYLS